MAVRFSYELPEPLTFTIERTTYRRWLERKAIAHVRRDRKRGNTTAVIADYKRAIHAAVCRSEGRDAYTGELLNWSLISTYDNARSRRERRQYKAGFALLPTIDHVGDGLGEAKFRICAWRTNDCKSDLADEEFVAFCRRVIEYYEASGRRVA